MFNKTELKRLTEKESKNFFVPGHINRCFDLLDEIKENSFDEEIVSAGILLHLSGFSMHLKFNQDLIKTSVNLAKKFLISSNFPEEKTDAVIHCIEESGIKGKPKSTEAVLVHDLNMLDEVSSVGIIKDSVLFNLRKIPLRKFLEEQKTKSFLLNEAFFSVKAKNLAEPRTLLFDSFVKSLEKELK